MSDGHTVSANYTSTAYAPAGPPGSTHYTAATAGSDTQIAVHSDIHHDNAKDTHDSTACHLIDVGENPLLSKKQFDNQSTEEVEGTFIYIVDCNTIFK